MKAPQHLPTKEEIDSWREFTPDHPIRILFGACLLGDKTLTDGTGFGELPRFQAFFRLPNVKCVKFCPEDFAIGTPRGMPDIHGGNGFDVLDGEARVLDEKGNDHTEKMLKAADRILQIARANRVDVVILPDISASCGSQAIYDGCRLVKEKKFQTGPGVCAGILIRNGFKVISHRDVKTLDHLRRKLDSSYQVDPDAVDCHESDWYRQYL